MIKKFLLLMGSITASILFTYGQNFEKFTSYQHIQDGIKLHDEEKYKEAIAEFKKVNKTGESVTIEVLLDWLGEKKWFSEYIYPFKNAKGEVVEIVKVCKDIHQRKTAEQEIENKNKCGHHLPWRLRLTASSRPKPSPPTHPRRLFLILPHPSPLVAFGER